MRFQCEKKELLRITNNAIKAVATKSLNTIHECILIEAEQGRITMKSTDLVLSILSFMPAFVAETGRIAVPARLFHEILSKYPEGEIDIKSEENNRLGLVCGGSKAALNYMQADEFPEFANFSRDNPVRMKEQNHTYFSALPFYMSTLILILSMSKASVKRRLLSREWIFSLSF